MGGWGSGGCNKTHGTVERYRRIDSFAIGRYFTDAEDPHEMLGPAYYLDNRFKLHWVRGIDGSRSRLYFGCPQCHRRVRYLYECSCSYACRHCLGANYESQQATKGSIEEIRRRMRKIVEDQLGYTWWRYDNPNCCINDLDIIPKPRYMRWVKYSALMMEFRDLQDEYWKIFIRMCPWDILPDIPGALNGYL